MKPWHGGFILLLLSLAACAVSPYQQEVNATCGQAVPRGEFCTGTSGAELCGMVLLVELPFIGACEGVYFLQHQLAPPPAKYIRDGVYRAPSGAFSVHLPHALPGTTYKAEQGMLQPLSYVGFMPSDVETPAYTVATTRLNEAQASKPLSALMPGRFGAGIQGVSYSSFGQVKRIRDPMPVTLDGKPALLGVYADFGASAGNAFFLVYYMLDGRSFSIVTLSWAGGCHHCKEGSEAEILDEVPGAADFVGSFHRYTPQTETTP